MRLSLLAGCLVLQASCVRYVPVPLDSLRVGDNIRARLSSEGVFRVVSQAYGQGWGLSDQTVTGRILQLDSTEIRLAVPWVRAEPADAARTLRQRLEIPHTDVLSIELRRTDYAKTGGLVALITVGTGVAVAKALSDGTSGSTLPPRGGGGDESLTSGAHPVSDGILRHPH